MSSTGQAQSLLLPVGLVLGLLIALGILAFAAIVILATPGGGGSSGFVGGTCQLSKEEAYRILDSTKDEPPAVLIPVYLGAAAKFGLGEKGPSILAAINHQESTFGRSNSPGVRTGENGSRAGGPMQFIPGTWETHKQDGNGDGKIDRYDPVDAIFAAAHKLRADGAPKNWREAIASYYGADVDGYVDSVLAKAAKYNLPGPSPC